MNLVVTAGAPLRCSANATGVVASDWGMVAVPCSVTRGLRYFTDRQGLRRAFCPSVGHEANAKRRFGAPIDDQIYQSEIADDPLGQAHALRDIFDNGRVTLEWHGHAVDLDVAE